MVKIIIIQDYNCTKNECEWKFTYTVIKLRVKQVRYESKMSNDKNKKAKAEKKSVMDLKNLCLLLENSVEGLASRRQHCWGYISLYENICKKLLHLPTKSCHNFTWWFKEGHSWNIIVTRLWLVLSLHPNTSSPVIYWRKWPNQLAHLELRYRKPDILERMLNWIVLSSSTAGKCTPMQVTQSIIMEGKKICILHELRNKMQLVVCGALWAHQWKTRGKPLEHLQYLA